RKPPQRRSRAFLSGPQRQGRAEDRAGASGGFLPRSVTPAAKILPIFAIAQMGRWQTPQAADGGASSRKAPPPRAASRLAVPLPICAFGEHGEDLSLRPTPPVPA